MVRRCAHWGGLAALGTVVAWSPVLAQTADGQAGDAQATDSARHLSIIAQVTTTYDDNVARSATTEAELMHLTPSDVYVQPSVTIDALTPVGRESIFLTGMVGYDFYDRNTVLNRERVDLTGGVAAQLLRCQQRLTGSYARAQSRLDVLLPGPSGAASISPQNTATSDSVGFDLACPRPEGLAPTFSVSYATTGNSNELYRSTDNSRTSVQGGLSYTHPGLGAIQAFGNFSSVAYDNLFVVPLLPFPLNNNYDLYGGGVRYDRPIGLRLSGAVSVSYSALRPAFALNPGFSGVTYSAELHYNMSTRLVLHATVSRAPLPSTQVGVAYVIDNPRQIDVNYKMGPRLTWTVGGSDDPQSYPGDLAGKIPDLVTSDRINRLFGSVNFALNKHLSVVLDAANEHRASNVALYNYTDNHVSLTLKGVF